MQIYLARSFPSPGGCFPKSLWSKSSKWQPLFPGKIHLFYTFVSGLHLTSHEFFRRRFWKIFYFFFSSWIIFFLYFTLRQKGNLTIFFPSFFFPPLLALEYWLCKETKKTEIEEEDAGEENLREITSGVNALWKERIYEFRYT